MDAQKVIDIGQGHLIEAVRAGDKAISNTDGLSHQELEKGLLTQLTVLNGSYPGGLTAYIKNAKHLLEQSRLGKNPFQGLIPSKPQGEKLKTMTGQFEEFESIGIENIGETGFVLVAGGLGERLGYNGIKISLPIDIITGKCFLQHYCESILSFQSRAQYAAPKNVKIKIPLAIMTSDDTHQDTIELLHKHCNFGLDADQITLLKQEKVASLVDNEAKFAINMRTGLVETKPHGHGDVHTLLHSSGTLRLWKEKFKINWVVFFQDTNALVFRGLLAGLGVSVSRDFDVNSLTVPRRPGEAVGAICHLSDETKSRNFTVNVEYNQLDPLLRATVSPEGDVADDSGFSPYPGNINVLLFKLKSYLNVLEETGGPIPEFVNPKYANEEKTVFKKPTRIECMMQDYPKLLEGREDSKVGFTELERFICFSAVKNNPSEAKIKFKATGFPESAASTESDVYATNRLIMAMAGVQIKTAELKSALYLGVPFPLGAKIILTPAFGVTQKEIREKFPTPEKVFISESSSLILDGDITIYALNLDGDLRITAEPGAKIIIKNLTVVNEGTIFNAIDPKKKSDTEEFLRIRGYSKEEIESLVIHQSEPGETIIDRS